MQINSTRLRNIRNIKDCSLAFSPSINFIIGPNGAGKTALLESFYIMSRGRPLRGRSIDLLINNKSNFLSIDIKVESENGLGRSLGGLKRRSKRLQYKLDGLDHKSFEGVGRQLPIQLILPSESELVYLGPEVRRAFLDWGLFHVEQGYLGLARAYRRALKQRNEWLRWGAGKADPWLEGLTELGVKINFVRQDYIKGVGLLFNRLVSQFSGMGLASLRYKAGGYGLDLNEAVGLMHDIKARDAKATSTNLGPHKADMMILMSEQPARTYCSRGQAKLISFCLALSQALYLKEKKGIASILLIDDIVAELDYDNLIQSLKLIKSMGMQVFITGSDAGFSEKFGGIFGEHSVFHVEQGKFTKEKDYGIR